MPRIDDGGYSLSYGLSKIDSSDKKGNYMNNQSIICGIILTGLLASLPISGCSSRKATTVETSDSYREPDARASMRSDTETTVTKTEESSTSGSESHGFFGIIGDIIAWPFHILSAIF